MSTKVGNCITNAIKHVCWKVSYCRKEKKAKPCTVDLEAQTEQAKKTEIFLTKGDLEQMTRYMDLSSDEDEGDSSNENSDEDEDDDTNEKTNDGEGDLTNESNKGDDTNANTRLPTISEQVEDNSHNIDSVISDYECARRTERILYPKAKLKPLDADDLSYESEQLAIAALLDVDDTRVLVLEYRGGLLEPNKHGVITEDDPVPGPSSAPDTRPPEASSAPDTLSPNTDVDSTTKDNRQVG